MKIHFQKGAEPYPYGKAVVWVFIIAMLLSYLLFKLSSGAGFCLFYELTGIPCPTCGLSRSLFSLSQFKISLAIAYNPLFLLVTIALALHLMLPLIFRIRISYQTNVKERRWVLAVFALLTLLNWIYLLNRF